MATVFSNSGHPKNLTLKFNYKIYLSFTFVLTSFYGKYIHWP